MQKSPVIQKKNITLPVAVVSKTIGHVVIALCIFFRVPRVDVYLYQYKTFLRSFRLFTISLYSCCSLSPPGKRTISCQRTRTSTTRTKPISLHFSISATTSISFLLLSRCSFCTNTLSFLIPPVVFYCFLARKQ